MSGELRQWLLELEIDGRVYRWAVEALEVLTDDGDTLAYHAGLDDDLELAEGDEDVRVTIADDSVDWVTLASEIECRPCVLRRWAPGTVLEEAVVFVRGEARGTSAGARHEPVSFTIKSTAGSSSLGFQIPDPLAQVDANTWPDDTADAGTSGDSGSVYPWIFGYPGYTGASTPIPCVPVPLAVWDADNGETLVVINVDPDAPISEVLLRNDDMDQAGTETVEHRADFLGRMLLVATFDNDPLIKPATADEKAQLFAGFHPDTGGGTARSAYDVLVQLCRAAGVDATDWARLPDIRDVLSIFQVDSYIDDPAPDPWSWFEDALLDFLPVAIRVSERGRYLVERRYVPTGSRLVGAITAGVGAERMTLRERDDESALNEYVAFYRWGLDDAPLARLVVNGTGRLEGAPGVTIPEPTDTQLITVQRSGLCADSLSRFGLKQADPIEIDWTWDTSTVAAVLEWMVQRDAIPPWLVEYSIENGDELREGDELELTDAELGWDGVLALVDAPPVVNRTRWASVSLRIPCG